MDAHILYTRFGPYPVEPRVIPASQVRGINVSTGGVHVDAVWSFGRTLVVRRSGDHFEAVDSCWLRDLPPVHPNTTLSCLIVPSGRGRDDRIAAWIVADACQPLPDTAERYQSSRDELIRDRAARDRLLKLLRGAGRPDADLPEVFRLTPKRIDQIERATG